MNFVICDLQCYRLESISGFSLVSCPESGATFEAPLITFDELFPVILTVNVCMYVGDKIYCRQLDSENYLYMAKVTGLDFWMI